MKKANFNYTFLSLLTALVLISAQSKADDDILLIDVNNVVPEIELIEKFLAKEQTQGRELGTRLVVVPSYQVLSKDKRLAIHNLNRSKIDPNEKYFEVRCNSSDLREHPNATQEQKCEEAVDKIKLARTKIFEIINGRPPQTATEILGRLDPELVLRDLDNALRGPYHFSRVIISGHHFPGDFSKTDKLISGELYTGFTTEKAAKALNGLGATKDVRSLILMGCWTGRFEVLTGAWSNVLPEAPYRSGFVGTAPAKTNPVDVQILETLLRNEKKLGQSKNGTELLQNYSKLNFLGRQLAIKVGPSYVTGRQVRAVP